MNPTALLKHLRNGRLLIGEHNKLLWASNSYWLFRLPTEKHPLFDLLADYNLSTEPMACEVGRTIKRTKLGGPDFGPIIDSAGRKAKHEMTRHKMGAGEVFISGTGLREPVEVWQANGTFLTFNSQFRRFCEDMAQSSNWRSDGVNTSPAVLLDNEDEPVAALMPVRSLIDTVPKDMAA
jgi:hypothetical protein